MRRDALVVSGILAVFLGVGCARSSTSSSTDLPTLSFSLPSSAVSSSTSASVEPEGAPISSAVAVTITTGTNALTQWAYRVDRMITYSNTILTKLTALGITSASGTFSKELTGGTVKGSVGALTGDSTYTQQLIVCVNGNKFLYAKWNADSSKIDVIRDFGVDPSGNGVTTAFKAEMEYAKSTDTTVKIYSYGTPWSVPADTSASSSGGSYLAEYAEATKVASDSSFTFKGVNAWDTAAKTSGWTGDVWLTGKLASDGSGDFLVYRKFNTLICTGSFSETTTSAPGWCFAGSIAAGGTVTFTNDATSISDLWTDTKLKGVGAAQDTSIKVVDFPSTVSCPS